jgi:hypothetical protein
MELANISQESEIQKNEFENDSNFNNSNEFEKVIKENYGNTLIQDIKINVGWLFVLCRVLIGYQTKCMYIYSLSLYFKKTWTPTPPT